MTARAALPACAALLALAACAQAAPRPGALPPLEVAVTFDDLPAHGPLVPGQTRTQILQALLAALRKHGVPQVYGFINGAGAEQAPDGRAALADWVAAGYPLGNHTYSHLDAAKAPVDAYLADVERNEPLLRELSPGPESRWKVFRYPYLAEGQDLSWHAAVRQRLAGQGYRVAGVSVDFSDWAWNEPYARCLAANDPDALRELKEGFLESAETFLTFDDAMARRLFGRRIPHVLLLHAGAFDAVMLDDLLSLYERLGVRWIPLDGALSDRAYTEDVQVAPTRGDTVQDHLYLQRKPRFIPWAQPPLKALDQLCR